MNPFLDADAFAEMFRPLSAAEELLAASLLEVVANWIVEQKPEIAADDPAAILVSFEFTRDSLLYGKYRPLSSFRDTTGDRTKAGDIDTAAVDQFITGRHRQMLGLATAPAKAVARFEVCDY